MENKQRIEAVSTKNDSVKVGGNWYTVADQVKKFVNLSEISAGDMAVLTLDDAKHVCTYLKIGEKSTKTGGKIDEIMLAMCYKIVCNERFGEIILEKSNLEQLKSDTKTLYFCYQNLKNELEKA